MDKTSWQKVGDWYDSIVGDAGSYYHTQIILPNVISLLDLQKGASIIDLGCGQGVLANAIAPWVNYLGLDAAKTLIQKAKARHKDRLFQLADITKAFPIEKEKLFSHAAIILALQNVAEPEKVFLNLRPHLLPKGKFVIVLNHPCFRIPRQSAWGFDEATKMQYRRLNGYMSPQKIPITAHPSKEMQSEATLSFHHPLSDYFRYLSQAGFVVEALEEWCSDKVSTGKAARWENRARKEFPLFLAIKASAI